MQPSRRAFLLGRPAQRTPWQLFCQRLRRACGGEFKPIHADASAPAGSSVDLQACWTPVIDEDVRQARVLCAEYGVQLALIDTQVEVAGRPVLWVDPAQLNRLEREWGPVPRWRAGPGVTLGELARAGLALFAHLTPERTLAAWFADRGAAAWPPGRNELSGVHAADVVLADGVADTLGPFGAQDGRPLRSASLQRLVPALFGLASGPEAQWCREQPDWPAHYRLDALLPQDPANLNLAQLLHGHGGTLVWLESLVLQEPVSAVTSPVSSVTPPAGAGVTPPQPDAGSRPPRARALDARVKSCFDPAGLFPELASSFPP